MRYFDTCTKNEFTPNLDIIIVPPLVSKRALSSVIALVIILSLLSALSPPALADKGAPKVQNEVVYQEGRARGRFIFFDLNESSGVIGNFGLFTTEGEKVLLRSMSIEGFVPEDIRPLGSLVKMPWENGSLVLHDNPTGLIHLRTHEHVNVTIVLSGEMVVVEERELVGSDDLSHQLVISDGRSKGVIGSNSSFEVSENGTVVRCLSSDLMVRFLPQLTSHQNWRERLLMQAVQEGKVTSEISFSTGDGASTFDQLSYRPMPKVQVQEVQRNRLQLSLAGDNPQGALILVRADDATMDLSKVKLKVQIDGEVMTHVQEPMDLLFADVEDASYGFFTEGDMHQIIILIPAGVLGSITLEGIDPLSGLLSPTGLAMVAGAIGLVALATVAVLRRF